MAIEASATGAIEISHVTEECAARGAGVRVGQLLISINGATFTDAEEVRAALSPRR